MTKADGGPAFPGGSLRFDDGDCETPYQIGMSLRDWFAGQALMSFSALAFRDSHCEPLEGERLLKARARAAYDQADAMLAARGGSDDQ